MITLIVAVSQDGAIGARNELLWHIPQDLKRFRKFTIGKNIVMGRKTFDSIISILGRPLDSRHHIVLSRSQDQQYRHESVSYIDDYQSILDRSAQEEMCIIGGAQIYAIFLPFVERMLVTKVFRSYPEADAFFPSWDSSLFTEVSM